MNDLNYSTVLTRCMLISALALGSGVVFPVIPDVVAFIGALVPLIWYHTMFLRPKAAEGLNQAAIDSVYYYGFLITIGALGATALDLSIRGIGDDVAPVAFQFGLGLLATGYAVWARVHLTAATKVLDEDELREIMSRQIERSRELLANIELASSSFESFANTLLHKSEQFSADTELRTRASVDAAMKAFTDGVIALSEQAQLALNDLRGIVNDVTFGAEREALRNSVTGMVETVAGLSRGLDQLKASTSAGASSVGEFAGSLERVNGAAAQVTGRFDALGREGGIAAALNDAFVAGTGRAEEFGGALDGARSGLIGLTEKVGEARDPIEVIGRKLAQAAGKVDKLADALESAGRAGNDVAGGRDSFLALQQASDAVAVQLSMLQQELAAIHQSSIGLASGISGAVEGMKASVSNGVAAVDQAFDRLVAASDAASAHTVMNSDEGVVRQNGVDGATAAI